MSAISKFIHRPVLAMVLSIVLVFAAGLLFGPIGMLLAVPVTAVILIIWRASRHA